jgi:T4 gene Gp59 loader of gp41 DNA helicase
MDAYEVFVLHQSLKYHFTKKKSYDYFKYQGKIKTSPDIFMKRHDRAFFMRIAKHHSSEDMFDFFLANFIKGKIWIGYFLEDDADTNFIEYLKRKESFSYHFKTEVETALSTVESPKDLFQCEPNRYPVVINQYLGGTLSLEVLVVLNVFVCFRSKYDATLDDPLWKGISLMMTKTLPFVEYDRTRIESILSGIMTFEKE